MFGLQAEVRHLEGVIVSMTSSVALRFPSRCFESFAELASSDR